jgi:hypothetical protein
MRQYDLLDRAVLTSAPLNIEITTLLVTSSQAQVGRSSPRLPGGLGLPGPFCNFEMPQAWLTDRRAHRLAPRSECHSLLKPVEAALPPFQFRTIQPSSSELSDAWPHAPMHLSPTLALRRGRAHAGAGHLSGAEEREPDDAEDQYREPGRDSQQGEHRRPGLGLACFGRGFDDLTLLSGCHGALNFLMSRTPCGAKYREQRMNLDDVPGFRRPRSQALADAPGRNAPARLATSRPRHG